MFSRFFEKYRILGIVDIVDGTYVTSIPPKVSSVIPAPPLKNFH